MLRMAAENGDFSDCTHCQSAGSVRAGRCQICEWEPPLVTQVRLQSPTESGGGTLTTTRG
jgi:hypothetical protein